VASAVPGRERGRSHAHIRRHHLLAVYVRRHHAELRTAHDYSVASGSFFTNAQERSHDRVLVVGPTVVSELFGGQSPVGDTIGVNGTNFEVIGVTASKGSNGTTNQDDVAFAPLTALQTR